MRIVKAATLAVNRAREEGKQTALMTIKSGAAEVEVSAAAQDALRSGVAAGGAGTVLAATTMGGKSELICI